jgi:hypothetical protein
LASVRLRDSYNEEMNRPIGLWVSAALAIVVVSGWIGAMLGAPIARYWYRNHPFEQGTLSRSENAHIMTVLSELEALQLVRFYARFHTNGTNADERYSHEIAGIAYLRQHTKAPEIDSVLALDLAFAEVDAAVEHEHDGHTILAAAEMSSAVQIFQSLGWKDCSEETLKAAATRDSSKWFGHADTQETK